MTVTATLNICNTRGLHARASAKFVKLASSFESEIHVRDLTELDSIFAKLGSIKMHADWGRKMSEHVVSGSNYWEVLRVVE